MGKVWQNYTYYKGEIVPVNKRYGVGLALDYGHDDYSEDEYTETLPYIVECRVHKTVCNYRTLEEAKVDAKGGWSHCWNFCWND